MAELLYQVSVEIRCVAGLTHFVGQYVLCYYLRKGMWISVACYSEGPYRYSHYFDVITSKPLKTDQENSQKGKEIMIQI